MFVQGDIQDKKGDKTDIIDSIVVLYVSFLHKK